MGNCLSCFERKRTNVPSVYVDPTPPPVSKPPSVVTSVKDVTVTSSEIDTAEVTITTTPSSTHSKMFGQHTKYSVVKKGSNGDKRSSTRDYSEAKIMTLFSQYKDPDEDAILAEGIEKFCCDLDVKPDDFIVLALAWKFQAQTMCRFSRDEFVNGCKAIHADSIKSIQSRFPDLLIEVQSKQVFKEFHKWAFRFGLDPESGQRMLTMDIAVLLWKLVFNHNEPPILDNWLDFLSKNPQVKGVSRDTWDMFYNFVDQVTDDLSNYDDTDAWPSLIDDFVEYETDRRNQNV